MGYGVMAYAVDIEVLRAPSAFMAEPRDYLDQMVNMSMSMDRPDGFAEALEELFFSRPRTGTDGSVYGYALESLCERAGTALPNAYWYPVGESWFRTVHDALGEIGVQFDPGDLVYSGSPVVLPEIVDFPGIGHLAHAELTPVAQALASADLSAIADDRVTQSIAEMRDWVRFCADHGYDLVSFYH
ncbi:DUF7691 family protein [Nocardia sp. NBC_00416]|uniref:DUF7691 family protein n=1 Tax=Nocardia sp. NBC_00416 TaxID=2975991 RepID=UPI002E23C9E6